jgi:hypothetical protein
MRMLLHSSSDERPTEDKIRARRVEVARRNSAWTELTETALVPRGRWLVDADSDELYSLHRGTVFSKGAIAFDADVELAFFVDRDGEVVLLEPAGRTWSSVVEKKAKRATRR